MAAQLLAQVNSDLDGLAELVRKLVNESRSQRGFSNPCSPLSVQAEEFLAEVEEQLASCDSDDPDFSALVDLRDQLQNEFNL